MLPNDIIFNVLNYLYIHDTTQSCSELEKQLFLDKEETQDIYIDLKLEGFISTNETSAILAINIKPLGRKYVEKERIKFENEIKVNYNYALLKFLYRENRKLKSEDFPENLKTFAPGISKVIDSNLAEAMFKLKQFVDHSEAGEYIINETGKIHYENLFYQEKEKELMGKHELGKVLPKRDINGTIIQENLVDQFFNPASVKDNSVKKKNIGWPLVLVIIAGVILIVISILKFFGKI